MLLKKSNKNQITKLNKLKIQLIISKNILEINNKIIKHKLT